MYGLAGLAGLAELAEEYVGLIIFGQELKYLISNCIQRYGIY